MRKYDHIDFTILPATDIEVAPAGMLFRAIVEDNVTAEGYNIFKMYESPIYEFIGLFAPTASEPKHELDLVSKFGRRAGTTWHI